MMDICVNTIVRNGDDFIKEVLQVLIPYVRIVVTVDSRSSDKTIDIVSSLPVEWDIYEINNPVTDLVVMRNHQLDLVKEKYVWIVDSDEYYPKTVLEELKRFEFTKEAYAFKCWAPWNLEKAHRASSKNPIPRIFKMNSDLRWRNKFGKEILYQGEAELLPYRYVHFTHLKKDNWRTEMRQLRVADDKHLMRLPPEVELEVKNILKI